MNRALLPMLPLKRRDYGMALLAIGFPLVSLALQVFVWPPAPPPQQVIQSALPRNVNPPATVPTSASSPRGTDPFTFHKIVAIVATGGIAFWIQIVLLKYERDLFGHQERRTAIRDVLDRTLRQPAIDADGSLNARLNLMVPRHWYQWPWFSLLLPRWWKPRGKLYMFSCSSNLEQLPEAGLPWVRNNGCAGELWATHDHYGVFCPSNEEGADRFNLSSCQERLTRRLRCIVSLAVFSGVGEEQRLRGFINLDSNSDDATDHWVTDSDPNDEVVGILQGLARFLVESGWLPY